MSDHPLLTPEQAYLRWQQRPETFIDVRETHEWEAGHLANAVHIPLGDIASKLPTLITDQRAPVVFYCASGKRSLEAQTTAAELGYATAYSMLEGFNGWNVRGLPVADESGLSAQERDRYSRHLVLPEVGVSGQRKLKKSRVLLLGAGGLGSPVAFYLAAAGVGTLGLVDDDQVELSNLQRQILHTESRIGSSKVGSARTSLEALNSDIEILTYETRLDRNNIMEIIDGYDVVVDGADNFPSRYLLNDAAVRKGIPVVSASILGFDGQLTVFTKHGPCYRCLYPIPPPPELAPSCGEGGVLGVLPGVVGLLQAIEVIKLVVGIGTPLIGRLMLYDALEPHFQFLKISKDPDCPVCSDRALRLSLELPDYETFCAS